jgi:hypothetical protein
MLISAFLSLLSRIGLFFGVVQDSGWVNNFSKLRLQAFSDSLRLDDHTRKNPNESAGSF